MQELSGLMRFLCVAAAVAAVNVLAQTAPPPTPVPSAKADAIAPDELFFLPLQVIQASEIPAHRFAAKDFPLVLLGRMPAEFAAKAIPGVPKVGPWACGIPATQDQSLLEAYATGALDPMQLQLGETSPAFLYIVGPPQNMGEYFVPAALERQGQALTLRLNSWRNNARRDETMSMRSCVILALPPPGPGAHKLVVEVLDHFRDVQQSRFYSLRTVRSGKVSFGVQPGTGDAHNKLLVLPFLREQDLTKTEPPPSAQDTAWQLPLHYGRSLRFRVGGKTGPGSLSLGTFDAPAWAAAHPDSWINEVPVLAPSVKGKPLYALIIGPVRDIGAPMTLSGIVRVQGGVKVSLDIWRDNTARKQNVPCQPLIIVPIDDAVVPGELKVNASITSLQEIEHTGTYLPAKDAPLQLSPVKKVTVEDVSDK